MADFILRFDAAATPDATQVGGKGVNLAKLTRAGFPVPPGFTVTTGAYARFVEANGLWPRIAALLSAIDYADADAIEAKAAAIRDLIVAAPLPRDIAKAIAAGYAALGKDDFVAVRSSGTAEDLAGASFAGQHDTYLDIRGKAAVLDAVRRCWASLWTARAVAYRQRGGFAHVGVGIAVVVQVMIASEVSGVMFTANPMTAAVDEYVVNASYGLGETIVSGIVTPDLFRLDRRDGRLMSTTAGSKAVRIDRDPGRPHGTIERAVDQADRERPSLDEAQLRKLASLGARVAEYYEDYPQDIEWGLADGRFYLLQSRDVTGVDFSWDEDLDDWQQIPKDDSQIWTRAWSDSVWSGAITPLFYSYRARNAQSFRADAAELWGMPDYAKHRVFKYHKAFAYYGSDIDYTSLSTVLSPSMRREGLMENLPPAWRAKIRDEPFSWTRVVGSLIRIGILRKDQRPTEFFKEFYRRFEEEAEEALAPDDETIAGMTDEALKRFILSRIDNERRWVSFLWTAFYFYSPLAHGLFTQMVENWAEIDDPSVVADLLTGLPRPSATVIENNALADLAGDIAGSKALRKLFDRNPGRAFFDRLATLETREGRAFHDKYRRFIAFYGHRGHADRDIWFERRGDDPGLDYTALQLMMTADREAAEQKAEAVVERRKAVTADVVARIRAKPFGDARATLFQLLHGWLLDFWVFRDDERLHNDRHNYGQRRGFGELGRRLVARGVLAGSDDHYFFSATELFRMLDTGRINRTGRAKLAARRRNHQRYRVDFTPAKYMIGDQYADLEASDDSAAAGVMRGVGTSRGRITGTARIIASQKDIGKVAKGEILITTATDPGWTPVFSVIAGLVLETGGMLAHGSCISREYGIPAVQLGSAMARIPDGATITVDGDTGQVILEEAA